MFTENLFQETLSLYKNSKCKSIALKCIRSYLKTEEFQKSFVKHINKLLGSSSSRLDGLQLIIDCIEQISQDVLYEEGLFWLRSCLTNHDYSQNKELNLKTLKCIIESSHGHSELSKKLATEYLNSILEISLRNESDLFIKQSSIECLYSCLKYYWTYCKQHRKKIEDHLLGFLESCSKNLVMESARAFMYCQKIPTGGSVTIPGDNLSFNFRKLCVTCHYYLDEIFEQWLEIESFEEDGIEPFNIRSPPPHYNSYLKLQYKTQIIQNISQWLIIFLSEETRLTVYSEVFSLFERGLSLHKCSKQDAIETKYLSFRLMEIQIKLLEMLKILILTMKSKIFPFYTNISEMMNDLAKNQSDDCFSNSSFQAYLYDILVNLSMLVGHRLEKPLQNTLVSQIISINAPIEDGEKVKIQRNMVGKSSKNKNNLILNSINSKSNRTEKVWTETKLKSAISSLRGLLVLIRNNVLDENYLDKITCFLVDNISLVQKGNAKAPFTDRVCQEISYKILSVLFEHENSNICWKYSRVIKCILVTGSKNENMNISVSCRDGLRNIEKIFEALQSTYKEQVEVEEDVSDESEDQNIHTELMHKKRKLGETVEEFFVNEQVEDEEKMVSEENGESQEISPDSQEKSITEKVSNGNEDQNIHIEPIHKKGKVEKNVEELFANEQVENEIVVEKTVESLDCQGNSITAGVSNESEDQNIQLLDKEGESVEKLFANDFNMDYE